MPSTFRPILHKEQIDFWRLLGPRPAPDTAVVLLRKDGSAVTLEAGESLTSRHIKWRRYDLAYWVDLSEQSLKFTCTLPSQQPGLDFQAEVFAIYRVNDPVEIVRQRVTDARAVLEPMIVREMRWISRRYPAEQLAVAEEEISRRATAHLQREGFVFVRLVVCLSVEEEERTHKRGMRKLERQTELLDKTTEYNKKVDTRDVQSAEEWIKFYNKFSHTGYAQFLLLHLASQRGAVQGVLQALNQQRQFDREHWLHMLSVLRDADGLEPQHLDELRKRVPDRLAEIDMEIKVAAAMASADASGNAAASGTRTSANGVTNGIAALAAAAPVLASQAATPDPTSAQPATVSPVTAPDPAAAAHPTSIQATAPDPAIAQPVGDQAATAPPPTHAPQAPLEEREVGGPPATPSP